MKKVLLTFGLVVATMAGARTGVAELPSFDAVSKDYKAVPVSDQQATKGFFGLWQRTKDSQLLAELPKDFANKQYFIALTVASGDTYAGLQSGDLVVKFRPYNERLALIAPNLSIRANGDPEAKASVSRLFTDQVLLDIPIVAKGPGGGPVIDMDSLLVNNASTFFGSAIRISNTRLTKIKKVKNFKGNVEIAMEVVGTGRKLQTLHYSFSEVPPPTNGFKPRVADQRVGYFTTAFSDLAKYTDEGTTVRYINRWNLQKRDPKLKLSPPKTPIRFYVEHTAPVRYRRWIKAGVDYWNKAYEKVGIVDAIVIEYQDAQSGIHMEKDPEDVRYNFIRWLNNDIGTAIGPSRVHPMTGEILDADIILTDGWIRHFNFQYDDLMPKLAMEGFSPETLNWLATRPNWDPRLRLASPSRRPEIQREIARLSAKPYAGYGLANADPTLIGDDEFDGLIGHLSQKNGMCMAPNARSLDLALARMDFALVPMANKALLLDDDDKDEEEDKKDGDDEEKDADEKGADKEADEEKDSDDEEADDDKEEEKDDKDKTAEDKTAAELFDMLDGMPDWFVGPLLADLVAHEVGHTLGLRHNFKASGRYTLDEINSKELKGEKTFTASVMDYTPINFRFESGDVQGDYGMIDIGPYDYWAIEYGYTMDDKKLPEILKRCVEPDLQFATDEDTSGPDPLARRYDFSKDPLDYCQEQVRLIKLYRGRILDKFVKDGDSWAKARRGYELTLSMQTRSTSMMANWIGGAFVNRDKKGDPENRAPVTVVPAEQQRNALAFVIEQTFNDEAFGLTPELLERMTSEKWMDRLSVHGSSGDATWPVHERVLGIQASAMTMILNPTTLGRVYDNELRTSADSDVLTLPEVLETVTKAAWGEISKDCPENCSVRKPMISSLRRNLQHEHIDRLVDLVLAKSSGSAATKPVKDLARMQLVDLKSQIDNRLTKSEGKMDPYSRAHLRESSVRIEQALKAQYTYGGSGGGGAPMILRLGKETE